MKKYAVFIVLMALIVVFLLYANRDRDFGIQDLDQGVVLELEISDGTFGRLNQLMHQALQETGATAATVALGQNGSIAYANYFGVADRSTGAAINYANAYGAGRLSQLVTAVSFAKLSDNEEMTLDLNLPVTSYLPDFTMADERYAEITPGMLLAHTSGIPAAGDGGGTAAEVLASLSETALNFAPGSEASYSGDNYALLELILEKVYGGKFTDYQMEKTFKIIKMKASFYANDSESLGRVPALYSEDGAQIPVESNYAFASYGLFTNAIDLCLLSNAYNASRAYLKPETIDRIFAENWALMELSELSGYEIYELADETSQSSAFFLYCPELRMSLALTVAGGMPQGGEIIKEFFQMVLQENGLAG